MNRIEGIIFHWSASGPTTTTADIRAWHKNRGWRDIGYHRVIEHPSANPGATEPGHLIKVGRHLDDDIWLEHQEFGAHALGYNRKYVGVCVVGGPGVSLHPLQREAVIHTAKALLKRFRLTQSQLRGHRDVNSTECPGQEVQDLVDALRRGKV